MLIKKYIFWEVPLTILVIGIIFPFLVAATQVDVTNKPRIKTETKARINTENPVQISKDVDISSDELEANLRKNIIIFTGNVLVKQKDLTLKSHRVTVYYQKKNHKKSTIKRIDATGNVILATKTDTIHATWGIYDFIDKIITLGGKVILKRHDGEIAGKRLIYNLNTGLITIDGRTKNNGRVIGQFTLPDKK